VDAALPGRLDAACMAECMGLRESRPRCPAAVRPGAAAALETLAERGIAVCLVSNTLRTPGTILRRILGNAGLRDAFAGMVFRTSVASANRNPAIFHCALAQLGVAAQHAVHVGDDAKLDVEGAHRAGMPAIQVGDGRWGEGDLTSSSVPDAVIQSLSGLAAAVDGLERTPDSSRRSRVFSRRLLASVTLRLTMRMPCRPSRVATVALALALLWSPGLVPAQQATRTRF